MKKNYYEIVMLLRPERDEAVAQIQQDIQNAVLQVSGKIDRFENIGLRQLAYPIKFLHKAIYLVFNVTCSPECLADIEHELRFNDSVLRQLIIKCDKAIVTESELSIQTQELRDQKNKTMTDVKAGNSDDSEKNSEVDQNKTKFAHKKTAHEPSKSKESTERSDEAPDTSESEPVPVE